MKVYCKNCKLHDGFFECLFKLENKKIYNNAIGTYKLKIKYGEPDILNKENKCKHYKRKWYLFYLKEQSHE
jgi:hypothetical protein